MFRLEKRGLKRHITVYKHAKGCYKGIGTNSHYSVRTEWEVMGFNIGR